MDNLTVEYLLLSKIIPYSRNPRNIKKNNAVATVKASLKEYGWQQPIVVDGEGVIVAGHTRYLAALELGWTEAPVYVARDLTPAQVKAYRLMDNKSHERAEWDTELLALEMEDLKGLAFDLDLTGFDTDELAGIALGNDGGESGADTEPQIDRADELRQQWGVETGQLWQLGEHRLLCGDSTKAEDVARVLDGDKPLLMVTDPPYGIEHDGKNIPAARKGHDGIANDERDCADFVSRFIKSIQWFDGSFYIFGVYGQIVEWYQQLSNWRKVNQLLIWAKDNPVLSRLNFNLRFEIIYYSKGNNKIWNGDDNLTDILNYRNPNSFGYIKDDGTRNANNDAQKHPHQKPIDLISDMIRWSSNKENIIYEPFSGSGTTIIAGENLGRKVRAIEISPVYVSVALQRYLDHTGKKPIRLP